MSLSYTYEKLYVAVSCLVTAGSIQERLANASISALIRLHSPDDFPTPELQDRFRAVWVALTNKPAAGEEGTINATTRQLSDDDGQKLAEEIFNLFVAVAGLEQGQKSSR